MENLYSYITLAAPTTTVVCPKPCILERIIVNKAAANGVITLYDHASSTSNAFGAITSPETLLQNNFSLDYGVYLKNGLTIVTSGAAQNITVVYRVSA